MNIRQIRFIKKSLVVVFVVGSVYVGYFVRKGLIEQPNNQPTFLGGLENPTSKQIQLEQLDSEGQTAWTLIAAESVAHTEVGQRFRDVKINFNLGDGKTPVIVTSELCEISSNKAVHFQGNVVVEDETSLRLFADTLEFRRFPDQVWSDDPVKYEKTGLLGTADRMRYRIRRGELDLSGEIDMTLQQNSNLPINVTSDSARMKRDSRWVQYVDDVVMTQGVRRLQANDLQLFYAKNDDTLTHGRAYENVDLQIPVLGPPMLSTKKKSKSVSSTSLRFEPGLKQILTDRLEIEFQSGGEKLKRLRALDGGKLVMNMPDDATTGVDKTLSGNLLAFEFDEEGDLSQLRGRGGVELLLNPRSQEGEGKRVRSRQVESRFDTETGELIEAHCIRSVEFEHADLKARAERGVFRAGDSLLVLTEFPRLWDNQGSINASTIEVNVETGDVEGLGSVRSSSMNDSSTARLFPGGEMQAVYFVSEHVAYRKSQNVAVYTGGARGFQGENRIEAETIEVYQRSGELFAAGTVRTVFLQELGSDDSKPSEPTSTITRSNAFNYRAQDDVMEYRENVNMDSNQMRLKGGQIDVTLSSEGIGVQQIYAAGEVYIETDDGIASGESARFVPKDKSMTVLGKDARLEKDGKVTEGKSLTFFLGDERILVDGQDQRRTRTTYSAKPN